MSGKALATSLLLELQKQRRTLLSVWLILVLSVVLVVAVVPQMTAAEPMRVFRLMMALLLSSGVPLIAALYAAVAAAALRRDPDAGIEHCLPVPPRTRVFAACGVAAFNFELTRWLLTLISSPLLAEDSASVLLTSIVSGSASLAWAVLMLETLLIAFTASYWFRLPLVGSAIALIAAGLQTFFAFTTDIRGNWVSWLEGAGATYSSGFGILQLVTVYAPAAGRYLDLITTVTWLGIGGSIVELYVLAPRLEREQRSGLPAILILVFVLAATCVAFVAALPR